MALLLAEPMIVGRSCDLLLLVAAADVDNPAALAQVWSADIGYSRLWTVQKWRGAIRFHDVSPPHPWQEDR